MTISIMLFLSMGMIFSYNAMNARLTVDNLAHQTAQWVRATQVTAMSVRHTADTSQYPGYGLYFDRTKPSQFIFFADLNADKHYQSLVGAQKCGDIGVECQKIITLLRGNKIKTLCGETAVAPGVSDCTPVSYASNLDIVFTRPDPDATIYGDDSSGVSQQFSNSQITLTSTQGYTRTIEVWTTGQVSVH